MLSIGIVGSESTAARILALSGNFKAENDVTFVKFAYDNVQDTHSIVRENDERIDIWLFSGELSFMIAKRALSTDDHLVYVKTTEANLYRCFLEIGHDHNNTVDTVSIDDNAEDTINDAMEQLSFNFGEIFIQTYDVDTDIEGLYEHHLSLYEAGKVKAVITSFQKVYSNLSEQGIPAYWYTMSNTEIRQALLIVKEKMKTLYFKETQIAIVMVDMDGFDKIIENAKSPYQLQYMELKIKEQLIELCQSLNGSLLEKGNGRYAIFSSRGIIEKNIREINQLKQSFSNVHNITASIGIGFGETAFSAELNAVQAVRQTEKRTHPESVMIQDEGVVIETRGNKKHMAFSTVSTEGIVSDKLKDANISLRTYNKIIGMINSLGRPEFTSKDLVNHLHIEARNSRRIVTNLSQAGLLEHVGDQASETKGRPSKVYRLVSVKD